MVEPLDQVKTIELNEWLTLATAPSPTKLKLGQTPYAYNTWVDEKPGSVITANGFRKVGTLPSNSPPTFCINYFKTSAGTQTFVVSDNATVWTTVDFQSFTSIITGLSSSFQLRGAVIRDKLWLTNGNDSVRTFDGSSVTVLDGTGGTPNVPKGRYISYHDERVWIAHPASGRSQCYFSALTDSSGTIIGPDNASAWPSTNFLQVSEGDADYLTGLLPYRGYLYFFKQYTIWRLVGYDEYTYTRVKTRASTGTRFNESLQVVDSLVHLIGVDGIYIFDGDEAERISDLIDPATAEQTAFGFNQLQQPNTNNLFWEVTATADWNTGTVPQNLLISNAATLQAKDDSQADFVAGTTLTNLDTATTPGSLQLGRASSGSSFVITSGLTGVLPGTNNGVHYSTIGLASQLTDQNDSNAAGYSLSPGNNGTTTVTFEANFNAQFFINKIALNNIRLLDTLDLQNGGLGAGASIFGNIIVEVDTTGSGNWVQVATGTNGIVGSPYGPTTQTISFTSVTCYKVRARIPLVDVNPCTITITELVVYNAAYLTTGQFVSRALDLGDTPASLGNFFASYTANGETITFQTQSSADGSSWDAAVAVTNGGAIGSTARRYLRWIGNFVSDGLNTPVLTDAWVGTLYESAVHDTGGSIFSWGAFEADYNVNGQAINFYYRGATSSGGVSAASWNLIASGGAVNMSTNNRYIQFKIEISGFSSGNSAPVVRSVTINWVQGTFANQPSVLQNVASFFWRNRYWLSAAGAGASSNNSILIRGKKTFGSPWQLRDWNILSFTRYLDNFYGTSSLDGSIYQLDTGYSKAGSALNSIFETGDVTFGGFQANVLEMLVETERLGPYTLFVGTSTDQGQTWTDHSVDLTLPTGGTTSVWQRINNLNLTTDKIRLRFYINDVDKPWQVHNCIVFYKQSTARGTVGVN